MVRDILNWQGVKIGEMSLPDDTTESVWQEKLAPYAAPPKVITAEHFVSGRLEHYERAAPELLRQIKTSNTLAGITDEQSGQMFDDFGDVLLMIREGAFPTALRRLQMKIPSGFVTQEMINDWIRRLTEAMSL